MRIFRRNSTSASDALDTQPARKTLPGTIILHAVEISRAFKTPCSSIFVLCVMFPNKLVATLSPYRVDWHMYLLVSWYKNGFQWREKTFIVCLC